MDDKGIDAGRGHGARHRPKRFRWLLIVDPDAALHGDGNRHGRLHGGDTFPDKRGFAHQTGAERAVLYAIRRAATVEVDFGITEILADPGAARQISGLRSAELHRDGLFNGVESKEPHPVAVDDRAGGHHLGVEQRAPRQGAMEGAAMPVRPVHHGGDAEAPRVVARLHAGQLAQKRPKNKLSPSARPYVPGHRTPARRRRRGRR